MHHGPGGENSGRGESRAGDTPGIMEYLSIGVPKKGSRRGIPSKSPIPVGESCYHRDRFA
jgi:hypothetical protein